MKRIILITLSVFVIFISTAFAAETEYINYKITDELPLGWTQRTTNSYSSVEITESSDEKSILISADTSSAKATTNAQLFTESFEFSGKQVFSLRMKINTATGYYKRIYINEGENKEQLLVIKDGNLMDGSTAVTSLATDSFFNVYIAFDTETLQEKIWVDDVCVLTKTVSDLKSYVGKDVQLLFWNGFTNKEISSLWYLSKVERFSGAGYNPVSAPENDAEFVDITLLDKISLDFGTVIPNLSSKSVKLEAADIGDDNYAEKRISKTFDSHSLFVTPTDGFDVLKSYRLTVSNVTDVFGTEHGNCITEFSTSPSGYSAPQCTIDVEKEEYFLTEMVDLNPQITKGSEELAKAELYVNSVLVKTYTEYDDINFVPDLGVNTVYVKVYDELGGTATSNIESFTVSPNTPPSITVNISDGDSVEAGYVIKASAVDTEGTIDKLILKVDGNKVKEVATSSLEWTVPEDTILGKHDFEISAVDNIGFWKTSKMNVEIVKFSESTKKISADFSQFTDRVTSGTSTIVPGIIVATNSSNASPRYIESGTVEGRENCVVMGADTKTSGDKAWLGVQSFSDSNRPNGIAIFETGIYLSSANAFANLNLKENDNGNTLSLIQFHEGKMKYYNGSETISDNFETDKWYDIYAEINLNSSKYTLMLNGEKIVENMPLSKTVHSLAFIRIEYGNYATDKTYIAISKFDVSDKSQFLTISGEKHYNKADESDNTNPVLMLKIDNYNADNTNIKSIKLFEESNEINIDEYKILKLPVVTEHKLQLDGKNVKFDEAMSIELTLSSYESFTIKDVELEKDDEKIECTMSDVLRNTITVSLEAPLEAGDYKVLVNYEIDNRTYKTEYIFNPTTSAKGTSEEAETVIMMTLNSNIKSDCTYKAVLTYETGEKEYNTEYAFKTDIDESTDNSTIVKESEFKVEDKEIKFVAKVWSKEDKLGTDGVTVIIAKYKNDIMTEMKYTQVDLSAGNDENVTTPAITAEAGVTYKAFIWNGWANGKRTSLTNKLFELSN